MMRLRVCGPRDKPKAADMGPCDTIVNCCSTAVGHWSQGLSPFILGPVKFDGIVSQTMENAWQYSKVYAKHLNAKSAKHSGHAVDMPNLEWFRWREQGFNNKRAVRYPMGRGAKPEYSWSSEHGKLSYIEARKAIYIPLYASLVVKTEAFATLKEMYENEKGTCWLWDFDGYNHRHIGMNLSEVAYCETRKMGHAFVLAMLLKRHRLVRQFLKEKGHGR